VVDRKQLFADLLNSTGDALSVLRSQYLERPQHHQGQRAQPDVTFLCHVKHRWESQRSVSHFMWESNRDIFGFAAHTSSCDVSSA
jgi:hypothetical protein